MGLNVQGTDKLKLVVIGKNITLRCFSNVKFLPVMYRAHSKAWMTSTIWEEIKQILDENFILKRETSSLLQIR